MSKALAKLDAMRVNKPAANTPKAKPAAKKPAPAKKAAPAPKKEEKKPEIEDYMPVVDAAPAKAEEKPAIEEFMPVVDAAEKTANAISDDLDAFLKKPEAPVAGARSYYLKDETHQMLADAAKKRGVSASRLLEAIIRKELTQ